MAEFKEIQIGENGQVYEVKDETARQNAGSGDGTVTGVKVGSTPYDPDSNGVVDLSTPFNAKVDKVDGKGLSKNDYTDADKAKVDSLKTVATSGSYNDLTDKPTIPTVPTMDAAPTAGNTTHMVSSDGVARAIAGNTPHIGENGNWWIGSTDTDIEAQGPAGDTQILDPTTFDPVTQIINNVSDGGETDALSAEMGKVLCQNILRIFNTLGPYAFPNGKPTLNWGSTVINHGISVSGVTGLTITDIEVDGESVAQMPSQITDGKLLSLKLNLPSNLYVFDDGVTITMGGVNITNTTGVWDESTGEINIAAVTDEVIITAAALTYVQDGLAFQLDGLNRGGTSGHWVDLIGGIDFTLNNCTENSDNVKFNGSTSYGEAPSGKTIDVLATSATVECAYSLDAAIALGSWSPILKNTIEKKVAFCLMNSSYDNNIYAGIEMAANPTTVSPILCANSSTAYLKGFASIKAKSAGGSDLTPEEGGYFNGSRTIQSSSGTSLGTGNTTLRIGINGSGATHFNGRLYSLRVYSRKLTDAEILQNYAVDQKRFNIL